MTIAEFQRLHPNFDASPIGIGNELKKDPRAFEDFVRMNAEMLKSMNLPIDQYHIDLKTGQPVKNSSLGKFLAMAALTVGGTLVGANALSSMLAKGGTAAATTAGDFVGPTIEQATEGFVGPTLEQAGYETLGRVAGEGGSDFLGKIGGIFKSPKDWDWKDILTGTGKTIGEATQAAGQNRLDRDEIARKSAADFENALMRRNQIEQGERANALDDVYRASWYQNRQAGPNNTRGITPMSPEYMDTLGGLSQMGQTVLEKQPQYSTYNAPPVEKFVPTDPSTMEKLGTWAGPILSIAGLFGKRRA